MKHQSITMEQAVEVLSMRICEEEAIDPRINQFGEGTFPRRVVHEAIKRVEAGMRDGTLIDTLAQSILVIDPSVTEGTA